MIILDFNSIAFANIFSGGASGLEEGILRHMILNSIRMYNLKFRDKYGRMYIASDYGSWRKTVFKEYKANRAKGREDSDLDWTELFRILNLVREEIVENFEYPVIHVEGVEADDIISVICQEQQGFGGEDVMIISADKDFLQLQRFANVSQFCPRFKKLMKEKDPMNYLIEHIVRGDGGDGIPNVRSADDAFVVGTRQAPITKPIMKSIKEGYAAKGVEGVPSQYRRNFDRNAKCIDLTAIPKDIYDRIVEDTYKQLEHAKGNKGKALNYLIKKRCAMLVSAAEEFTVK